jgi:hypothetical protein
MFDKEAWLSTANKTVPNMKVLAVRPQFSLSEQYADFLCMIEHVLALKTNGLTSFLLSFLSEIIYSKGRNLATNRKSSDKSDVEKYLNTIIS